MPSKTIIVKGGATYAVSSAAGCTVSVYAPDGTEVQVCEVPANKQVHVTAHGMKLVVSDDSALVTEVFNGAPAANNGGGGGEITPAEQAALARLVGGTISANGSTLTFKLTSDQKKLVTLTGLDELNTGGAPINTLNGNVYHGDGSANFTQTISGQIYQTSIDAHHVECRWNGDLKVHLHADVHGNAVLELNGARVLSQPLGTLVEGVDTMLQHNGFYVFDTPEGDFNLAMLSVASATNCVTTARIAIIIPEGARDDAVQWWPPDWNWLEGAAPQLESGKMHFVSVERFEIYINAHLSHSNPL